MELNTPQSSFIGLMNRAKNIKRWALMSQTTTESLGNHCYESAVIGITLGAICQQVFNQDVCPHKVASMCVMHEASEVAGLSDVPSPAKYLDPETTAMFKQLERKFEEKMLRSLPDQLQSFFEPLIMQDKSKDVHAQIAKSADVICAYLKCEFEIQKGNNEFKRAMLGSQKALYTYRKKYDYVEYFCEHFLQNANGNFDDQIDSLDWLKNTDGEKSALTN